MAMVAPRKKEDRENKCVYSYDRQNRSAMLRATLKVSDVGRAEFDAGYYSLRRVIIVTMLYKCRRLGSMALTR